MLTDEMNAETQALVDRQHAEMEALPAHEKANAHKAMCVIGLALVAVSHTARCMIIRHLNEGLSLTNKTETKN